jgi:mannose-6-phosphate isomerase
MNLIKLEAGQAIFQTPGTLHAYLEGVNLECMKTSDNTLRGGLTEKHIDIAELLRALHFKSGIPPVIMEKAVNQFESEYPVDVTDFQIRVVRPPAHTIEIMAKGRPEIWAVLKGSLYIQDHNQTFNTGDFFFVFSTKSFKIKSLEKESHIFRIY